MGLSRTSTGRKAAETDLPGIGKERNERLIALAGNPNVGKSTVFNGLTGMKQHTGNWTGKTVAGAVGRCRVKEKTILFADLPGCYSLNARSAEESVARDFICFGGADRIAVVCDASCLERNFLLVMQILEAGGDAVVCVNLADEAEKKGLTVDIAALTARLGVPVVSMSARKGKEAFRLLPALEEPGEARVSIRYCPDIEHYITDVSALLCGGGQTRREARFFALRLLDSDPEFTGRLARHLGISDEDYGTSRTLAARLREALEGQPGRSAVDEIAEATAEAAAMATEGIVRQSGRRKAGQSRLDRLLTGRVTGFPIMLLMLLCILWLTVRGANYPSALLSELFASFEEAVRGLLLGIGLPRFPVDLLCEGVIRVTGWVISVMLPPMAIFFPLFTLLEDMGYLPRVAFNLDRCFKKCSACGKQALTMCMGFGCNAAGAVGCRIIDSPRERLIALLTNSFMPCNGRFPMLIAVISMFFASSGILSAGILTLLILFAVLMTLLVSKLLSMTVLKGIPSSFTLELPPYRTPQLGRVLIRSVLDRTVFVLGRAAAVAAPTGLVLWLLANLPFGEGTMLSALSGLLDAPGRLMGLDGVILLAFLLGMPANEIVIPIIMMCYTANGSLVEYTSLGALRQLLTDNGWTAVTALNMVLFTVFHWPCSTTILTIRKETGSLGATAAAVLIPTAIGFLLCCTVRLLSLLF